MSVFKGDMVDSENYIRTYPSANFVSCRHTYAGRLMVVILLVSQSVNYVPVLQGDVFCHLKKNTDVNQTVSDEFQVTVIQAHIVLSHENIAEIGKRKRPKLIIISASTCLCCRKPLKKLAIAVNK